jgi:hypothetical protein
MVGGDGPSDNEASSFPSAVSFGLLFALFHMGPTIPPGRRWDSGDIESAIAFLATLDLLEGGLTNAVPVAELCELLRPHVSERFVEKPSERDILILFAVVILSAQMYGEDPASWPDAVSAPSWLETIVGVAVGQANRVSPKTPIGRHS